MGLSFWLAVVFWLISGRFFVSAAKQVPDFEKSGLLGDLSVALFIKQGIIGLGLLIIGFLVYRFL